MYLLLGLVVLMVVTYAMMHLPVLVIYPTLIVSLIAWLFATRAQKKCQARMKSEIDIAEGRAGTQKDDLKSSEVTVEKRHTELFPAASLSTRAQRLTAVQLFTFLLGVLCIVVLVHRVSINS